MRKVTVYERFLKRPLDFFGALFLALFLTFVIPIIPIVAVLVRIKHGKGIIFTQRRVGKDKRVFNFYKFRSMSNKRDENGDLLPDVQRTTKFGKFIRKTSLDELPQLWNIIKGDMSFIGPRPKDVKECVFFNDEQCKRFQVRPGITGLAQVSGRNSINFEQIAVFDAEYAKKVSLWKDIKIGFRTIGIVFKKESIDADNQIGGHFCTYYNDLLLERGDIIREEYDMRIEFSKKLAVGMIMPSIDEQRTSETMRVVAAMEEALDEIEKEKEDDITVAG